MFSMLYNERYDGKCVLNVSYAPWIIFWCSDKIIEKGLQNTQKWAYLVENRKKFENFSNLGSSREYVFWVFQQ